MSVPTLAIAYRICPHFGRFVYNPAGWPKLDLAAVCLRSLVDSLGDLDYRLHVILDGCPREYRELFEKTVPSARLRCLETDAIGNNATFLEQIRLLLDEETASLVYLAEDDYLYLPEAIPAMVEMLRRESEAFVTAYDHPDYYIRRPTPETQEFLVELHDIPVRMAWEAGCHWRQAVSTTCTFMGRRETLKRTAKWLRLYPWISDYGMWMLLTRLRCRHPDWRMGVRMIRRAGLRLFFGRPISLWCPVPGLATHLVTGCLSPGRDWDEWLHSHSNQRSGKGEK